MCRIIKYIIIEGSKVSIFHTVLHTPRRVTCPLVKRKDFNGIFKYTYNCRREINSEC